MPLEGHGGLSTYIRDLADLGPVARLVRRRGATGCSGGRAQSFFREKYQSLTSSSFDWALFSASSAVWGGGTMTGSPGVQLAGSATPCLSAVCKASTTR